MPACNGKLEDGRDVEYLDADLDGRLYDLHCQGKWREYRKEMFRRMHYLDRAANTRPMTDEEAMEKMRSGIVRRMKVNVQGVIFEGIVVNVTFSEIKGAVLSVLINFPSGRSSTVKVERPNFFEVPQLEN